MATNTIFAKRRKYSRVASHWIQIRLAIAGHHTIRPGIAFTMRCRQQQEIKYMNMVARQASTSEACTHRIDFPTMTAVRASLPVTRKIGAATERRWSSDQTAILDKIHVTKPSIT